MIFEEQNIKGVWVITPKVLSDDRGYFMESFRQPEFDKQIGYHVDFIQDNESQSSKGVLRGMHYQKGDSSQAKLVRVIQGSVLDVVIDLRKSSPSFGEYYAIELNTENKKQLFVPRGFAHGFLVLEDQTIFCYKIDNVYAPDDEASILWNDADVNIDWRFDEAELVLSDKDREGLTLSEAPLFD